MITAPDAVYVIIPCMKELGMSWSEIKDTPRIELIALLAALNKYDVLHSFDGYTADEIGDLAKNKPQVRSQYGEAMGLKAKYELRSGQKRKVVSFSEIL
jgi:hypothetical protein